MVKNKVQDRNQDNSTVS